MKRSIAVVDTRLHSAHLAAGLKAGDSYDRGEISVLKTSQLLWAISRAATHTRSNQNRNELRHFLIAAAGNSALSEYWNRLSNLVFAILALTAESQDVLSPEYTQLIKQLIDLQHGKDGSWGLDPKGPSSVRGTAMACFALVHVSRHAGVADSPYTEIPQCLARGTTWLLSVASPNGPWGRTTQFSRDIYSEDGFEPGVEVTAWCILALCEYLLYQQNASITEADAQRLERAMRWLVALPLERIANQPEFEKEHYTIGSERIHDYEAAGLEMVILSTLSYRLCAIRNLLPSIQLGEKIYLWTDRLLRNERKGYWYCKNCADYHHLWTIAYALVTLSAVRTYLVAEDSAVRIVWQRVTEAISVVARGLARSPFALGILVIAIILWVGVILAKSIPDSWFSRNQNFFIIFGTLLSCVSILLSLKSGSQGRE